MEQSPTIQHILNIDSWPAMFGSDGFSKYMSRVQSRWVATKFKAEHYLCVISYFDVTVALWKMASGSI